MAKTFLFYDIETTGLNKAFDQILQFAAIRTDEDLNEIERHEIFIKLNMDVVPSPQAMITHRIPIAETEKGMNELDAIEQIHNLVNTPNTISIGYNTLGFDDEFLRFSFYRNLLPPYTHQYANQCGRMDIYPMTLVYYLFNPSVLSWPMIDNKVSMKLADLNRENNLAPGQAHNAIADVEATLALAKKLKQENEMWQYLQGYFDKASDIERMRKLPVPFLHYSMGILVDGKMGHKDHYMCPVLGLGQHHYYTNQSLWLRLDQENLSECKLDSIPEHTFVISKKAGEPGIILPFKDRYSERLSEKSAALCERNLYWLQENSYLLQAIEMHYKEQKYEEVPNLDVDAALYAIGFPTQEEQRLCMQFHQKNPKQKVVMLEQMINPTLKEQAIRIIGRHFHQELTEPYKARFDQYLDSLNPKLADNSPRDYRNQPRYTAQQALKDLQQLLIDENLDKEQQSILLGLQEYINNMNRRLHLWP